MQPVTCGLIWVRVDKADQTGTVGICDSKATVDVDKPAMGKLLVTFTAQVKPESALAFWLDGTLPADPIGIGTGDAS